MNGSMTTKIASLHFSSTHARMSLASLLLVCVLLAAALAAPHNLPSITAEGSPYEIGVAIGSAFKSTIHKSVAFLSFVGCTQCCSLTHM